MRSRVAIVDASRMFGGFDDAIRAAGYECLRVESWVDVEFLYVQGQHTNVSLSGVPLDDIAAILYSGAPDDRIRDPRDYAFVKTERDRALAAAFKTYGSRVINAGWALSDDWTCQTPEFQLLKLGDAGWPIADVVWRFDPACGISKETYGTELPTVLLVVGCKLHYGIASGNGPEFAMPDRLLRATRRHLQDLGLDWATVPIAFESRSRFAACGFGTWLPAEMSCDMRTALLLDAMET
jgi:hypothetical protein